MLRLLSSSSSTRLLLIHQFSSFVAAALIFLIALNFSIWRHVVASSSDPPLAYSTSTSSCSWNCPCVFNFSFSSPNVLFVLDTLSLEIILLPLPGNNNIMIGRTNSTYLDKRSVNVHGHAALLKGCYCYWSPFGFISRVWAILLMDFLADLLTLLRNSVVSKFKFVYILRN